MLRPLLEVLERGFYLPDPVVAPPCVRGQLVALSTALLEMLPSFSVIGDNVHGVEAVTVNLSLAVMCEMWCGTDGYGRRREFSSRRAASASSTVGWPSRSSTSCGATRP